MNRWIALGLLFATVVALTLRIPALDRRPMHNDEAVNGIKFVDLRDHGTYKYDPNEHHGPTLYYATLALGALTGAPTSSQYTDARLRLVTLLFGVGLIGLLPLTVRALGRRPTIWAGLYIAVSPAMVFYSCYYIHEMLLVFFTYLAMAAGWLYWRTRRLVWILLAGAAVGLMDATKETFVISLVVAGLALLLNQLWNWYLDATGPPIHAPPVRKLHLAAAITAWLLVAIILFTSFFTNAAGPLDSLRTYAPWLNRAGGDSPHIHPWYFYFHRLLYFHPGKGPVWTEMFIVILALVGTAAGFIRRRLGRSNASFIRFLALYSFGLAAAYSIISYKTPWCLLSFWHGMLLLAGVGTVVLIRSVNQPLAKLALRLLLVAGASHLGWQAWQLAGKYSADQRNPYAYAQTTKGCLELVDRVQTLTRYSPQGNATVIKVMAPEMDYWPLPWYLRNHTQVGYWSEIPPDPYSPLMIVSARYQAELDQNKTHLMVGYAQLRPKVFFELYVSTNLWMKYLAERPPPPPDD